MERSAVRHTSVILADDDADDQDIFCAAIKEINPHISLLMVASGKELLQVLEQQTADFLFLDINMFPLNGMEVLQKIKENRTHQNLPVIMFSSSGRPADVYQAYQLGATLFIRKTDTYEGLKAVLQKAFGLDWSQPQKIKEQFLNTCFTAP